jgi:hypothetical protein
MNGACTGSARAANGGFTNRILDLEPWPQWLTKLTATLMVASLADAPYNTSLGGYLVNAGGAMRNLRILALLFAIAVCGSIAIAQNAPNSNSADTVSKKEKFELGIEMLKGYRTDLQDRFEKSGALLIVVIGWLITSDTARKSLTKETLLFWGGAAILTALIVMYCVTISHFIERYLEIQTTVESLGYVDSTYFVRYHMPATLFLVPVQFIYIVPVLFLYLFILMILRQIKLGLI